MFGLDGSEYSRLSYPRDICYLDRWNAPSSAASSLFLIIDCNNRLSIWDAEHFQYISNVDLGCCPYYMCVDLNGFIYVGGDFDSILILDPRKNYRKVQTLCCNGDEFGNLCIDDRNRLMVIDYTNQKLKIF